MAAKNTIPPAPQTGKQTKKCYLRSTGDCDGPASAEHFIPRSVLSEISDTRINFDAPGISFSAHPKSNSFAVKSLCGRHNSALHGLDTELGRFTRTLKHIYQCQREGRYEGEPYFFFFNGHDIERSLLKILIGAKHHRMYRHLILPGGIESLLLHTSWPLNAGMYFSPNVRTGEHRGFSVQHQVSFSLVTYNDLIVGLDFTLFGFPFKFLILHRPGKDSDLVHQPGKLFFYQGQDVFWVSLVWDRGDHPDIGICRDPNAPLPEGIREPLLSERFR